jgi:hypothetical protein
VVDEADRRARRVGLTASGRAVIEKAFGAHERRMNAAASGLTPGERATLHALLKKVGLSAAALLESEEGAKGLRGRPRRPAARR